MQLSPERIQLAGIKTVPVEYRPMARQTKTVGYVTYDESRLSEIVSRVEGYVEKLYVDKTFTVVHQGDPLAEIYSPELYSTAQELVLADARSGIGSLAASAREKLLLFGVSPQEIDGIVASGRSASPRLVIRSPQTGYVVDKKIVEGASVEAKMTLFEVADLSTVWIEADVYEKDIAVSSRPARRSRPRSRRIPTAPFPASSRCVYPQLDSGHADQPRSVRSWTIRSTSCVPACSPRCGSTRRWRADRAVQELAEGRAAKEAVRPMPRLTSSSPCRSGPSIDTGSKKVVYVEREPGLFEGVEVELGPRAAASSIRCSRDFTSATRWRRRAAS